MVLLLGCMAFEKGTLEERFWRKVRKTDGCWIWTAATNNKGYGVFETPFGRLAHRFSWYLAQGTQPKHYVLHHCDNSLCVRPDHLYDGTQTDNMHDLLRRGRIAGRVHGRSRLTPDDVRAIRVRCKAGVNDLAKIAKQYGITPAAVGHIKYGVTWRWLQ